MEDDKKDKKDKFKIHSTTDYNQFKYIKGNREVVESHVKTLSDQIAKKDFQIPIIVNEKMKYVKVNTDLRHIDYWVFL